MSNQAMGASVTILTIEDEAAVRKGMVAYLEDSGFQVLEADDGPSGIEIFEREHPDVVLCDLRLPGIDGLEVLSTITGESPETPVIIVSGANLLDYAIQALKRGAWDYVTKPLHDMVVLEQAVHRVLERADLIRQNREYREHLEVVNKELTLVLDQLREDEEAGRRIQLQLLPQNGKEIGGYVFNRRLLPSTYLSGDFVDYFPVDDHRLGFYMADVSGHGAASAFVTVMLRALVGQYRGAHRQEGDETVLCPERLLRRLNRAFYRQELDKYFTMFYGVIDARDNSLSYSSGAQLPYPMLYDGRSARVLSRHSVPIGLFEEAEFEVQRERLPEQFVLALVSDGVLEILPQKTQREKCAALLAVVCGVPPTIDAMTRALGLHEERELPDDIALLVVRKGGGDGTG